MTSIDLYDQLIKNRNNSELESQRATEREQSQQKVDQFEVICKECVGLIEEVKQNNREVIRFKDRLVSNTRPEKETQISAQLREICDQNYQVITKLREQVIQAGKIVEQLKQEEPNQPETFSKIYRKQYLAQQVDGVLKESYTVQKIVQKFSIDTTLKRIRIVLPEASEEGVRELASKPKGLETAMRSRIAGKASTRLKNAHADIMSKAEGIAELEAAVGQNLRLMKEVALLVQQQGEMIDTILTNVEQARDYVAKGQAVLVKEKKQHKKSRKKMCCIILIGLVALALILTPIIVKVTQD